MPLVRIDNVAALGIIRDVSPYDLPPEAWSQGNNVRFIDGRVKKVLGHKAVFGTPSIAPYHLMFVRSDVNAYWVYPGLTKVFVTDMTSHFDITRASGNYSATAARKWNGGTLNGIPILNNGFDIPQVWTPISTSQKLIDFPTWDTWPQGSTTRARVIRPAFRFFLVALSLTEDGTEFPQVLAWSSPAEPGAVPASWDYISPFVETGKTPVADTPGSLLDLVMLGGRVGILYKSDSAYIMQYTGGIRVFSIDILKNFDNIGLLGTGCVRAFPGGHFMVTQDDVIVHNATQLNSVINAKVRNTLFDGLGANRDRSFVLPNYLRHEMWFFYVAEGQEQPNQVMIYNWDTGGVSFRDLGGGSFPHAALGGFTDVSESSVWDVDSAVWNTDNEVWDTGTFNPATTQILLARNDSPAIYLAEQTNQFAGVDFIAFIERIGLSIVGRARDGSPRSDHDSIKLVTRVIPRLRGGPVTVMVGHQDQKDGPVTWDFNQIFDPAVDKELTPYVVGRYLAVRFESSGNSTWELEGYSLEVAVVGRF